MPQDAASAAGVTTDSDVGESTVNSVAETDPNLTPVTLVKFVPVIVTTCPPAVEPAALLRPPTVGSAPVGVIVNCDAALVAEVPPGVTTVMFTLPAEAAGA